MSFWAAVVSSAESQDYPIAANHVSVYDFFSFIPSSPRQRHLWSLAVCSRAGTQNPQSSIHRAQRAWALPLPVYIGEAQQEGKRAAPRLLWPRGRASLVGNMDGTEISLLFMTHVLCLYTSCYRMPASDRTEDDERSTYAVYGNKIKQNHALQNLSKTMLVY